MRGAGDGERNRLFAEAYGKDPDFFAFYRSMTAYENGLKSNDTRFLLRPDSDFFRFFSNSVRQAAGGAAGGGCAEAVRQLADTTGSKRNVASPRTAKNAEKQTSRGRFQSDEVHSVRRLPHRSGHPVCA